MLFFKPNIAQWIRECKVKNMSKKEQVVIRINENSPFPVIIRPTTYRDGQKFSRIKMIEEGVYLCSLHPIPASENHSDDLYDSASLS